MLVWEKVGVLELGGPRWKIETISDAVKMRSLRSINWVLRRRLYRGEPCPGAEPLNT
jgi:hypothetical protein